MSDYYRGLIALRRENAFLTSGDVPECELLSGNVIAVTWQQDGSAVAFALINPNADVSETIIPDGWSSCRVLLQDDTVLPDGSVLEGDTVQAAPKSVTLIVKNE